MIGSENQFIKLRQYNQFPALAMTGLTSWVTVTDWWLSRHHSQDFCNIHAAAPMLSWFLFEPELNTPLLLIISYVVAPIYAWNYTARHAVITRVVEAHCCWQPNIKLHENAIRSWPNLFISYCYKERIIVLKCSCNSSKSQMAGVTERVVQHSCTYMYPHLQGKLTVSCWIYHLVISFDSHKC